MVHSNAELMLRVSVEDDKFTVAELLVMLRVVQSPYLATFDDVGVMVISVKVPLYCFAPSGILSGRKLFRLHELLGHHNVRSTKDGGG